MNGYNHQAASDLIAETLRRSREKAQTARQAEIKAAIRASRKAEALRFLAGPGRAGLNLMWRLLIWISQITAWILILLVAIVFAETIAAGLDVNHGHGAIAAAAVYCVAVIGGIRAARDVSNGFRAFARTW